MERKQFASRAGIRAAALLLVLALLLAVPAGALELAEGSHTRWIDRIADLPDYAMTFYEWLEDEAEKGMDGALADPEQDRYAVSSSDGVSYVLTLEPVTVQAAVTQEPGASQSDKYVAAFYQAVDIANACSAEMSDYISETYYAFLRDHPEVFWLNGEIVTGSGFSYEVNSTYTEVTVTVEPEFTLKETNQYWSFDLREELYTDTAVLSAAIGTRDAAVETILADCPTEGRYEQVKYLNHYLTTTNCYNSSDDLNAIDSDCRSCLGALTGRSGATGPVCEAYAKAFMVLCRELDIPCVLVDGAYHMWNYVRMEDENWYAVDVTYNDPMVYGVTGVTSGYEHEDYLLVGSQTVIHGSAFIAGHPVENKVNAAEDGLCFTNGPVLSETAYDPDNVVLPVLTKSLTESDGAVTAAYGIPTHLRDDAAYVVLAVYNGAGKLLKVTMEPVCDGAPLASLSLEGLLDPAEARSFLLNGSHCPMTEAATLLLTTS